MKETAIVISAQNIYLAIFQQKISFQTSKTFKMKKLNFFFNMERIIRETIFF